MGAAALALVLDRLTLGCRDRLDIGDQGIYLFFADQSLKRGHDRLESFHPLRARVEDAFANVVLVGGDGASIFELDRLAKNSLQVGAAALRVIAMAGGAAEFGENLLARRRERTGRAAVHPRFILSRLHDYDGTDHAGVLGAAVFRAEQVISARLGSAKPFHGVAAGQHVLLDAKGWYVEAVNHVLRGHDQFHVPSDGYVQFVDLTLAFGVLEFPHPLFCHDINFGGIVRWGAFLEIHDRAPGKDRHEYEEWNRAPGDFERSGTFDLLGGNAGAVAKAGSEVDEAYEDEQGHHPGDDEQENVESVYVARHRGGLLRP